MMVVYPDAIWYRGVDADGVRAIFDEHLAGGRPAQTYQFAWPSTT
jgi:(2Fe-2S) ferredoxin